MKFKINKTNKKYAILSITAMALILAFIFIQMQLSGKVTSGLDLTYIEKEALKGTLTLTTSAGELIPGEAILKFTTEQNNYEFLLRDLLDETELKGDYYVEEETISGSGSGFGLYGNTEDPQSVSFTLIIEDKITEESPTGETPEETPDEETTIETPSNETEETTIETPSNETEEATIETTPTEEVIKEAEEVVEEIEEEAEEVVEEIEEEAEEVVEEIEEEAEEVVEETKKIPKEKKEKKEKTEEATPITGLAINENLDKTTLYEKIKFGIASLFGEKLTGRVSYTWEGEKEITGTVDSESPFTLEIPEGKTVKIKSDTVKDDSTPLNNEEISLVQLGNTITITTEYQNKGTRGFGEKYLGENEENFVIDITNLNLTLEKGELIITLEYDNTTIIETTKTLGELIEEIPLEILPLENATEEQLTERLNLLYEKLGNVSLVTTEEEVNNKIIIKHEIGTYWATLSYDSNLELSKLEEWKNIDKRRFIEDILNKLE